MPSSASAAAASAAPPPPPAAADARPASTYPMSATSVRVRQVGHSTRRWACARAAAQRALCQARPGRIGSCRIHSHALFPQHRAVSTVVPSTFMTCPAAMCQRCQQSRARVGQAKPNTSVRRAPPAVQHVTAISLGKRREQGARPRHVAGQAVDERHLAAHAQLVPARQHGQLRAQRLLAHRAQLRSALARPGLACAPRAGLNHTPWFRAHPLYRNMRTHACMSGAPANSARPKTVPLCSARLG